VRDLRPTRTAALILVCSPCNDSDVREEPPTLAAEPASNQTDASPRPSIWGRKSGTDTGDGPLENPQAGEVHFDMEAGTGKPSRWNTLRRSPEGDSDLN
jgi:hypothetical protein